MDHYHYTEEYRGVTHSIFYLKSIIYLKIYIAFHNGFNYDYHFVIKQLAEKFENKITCLGENNDRYITFTVPIEIKNNNKN